MRALFRIKPFDGAAIALAVVIFAGTMALTVAQGAEKRVVHIESPAGEWLYPLDAEIAVQVLGPLGATHVHIHDGRVFVSESPCREKICVATGRIDRAGSWIACLPNRVFVRVEGRGDNEVDGLAF
jgi:hypothetical protein